VKRYLVLYNSSVPARDQMASATPEQARAGMEAWMSWAQQAGDAVVDLGAPIGPSGRISASGLSVSTSQASGYSVLQANSKEEIDALLEKHPHLNMPGSSIDVFEALPIPGS